MSWAAAVVFIVAIIALSEVLKARYHARRDRPLEQPPEAEVGERAERNDPMLQREVEELRERVKVLERIATEDRESKRLSAEIDALRVPDKTEERSKQ